MQDASHHSGPARGLRRDAQANHERLVEAALRAIERDGFSVPVLTIAQEAGLGVATFYRSFADRQALVQELEHRAYERLIAILGDIRDRGISGLAAVESFLIESLTIASQLILPLHGATPLVDSAFETQRQTIDAALEIFLAQARTAGAIRADVNATDVIVCSALITQRLHFGSQWEAAAMRHVALFLAGLASTTPLPAPPISQSDVEGVFRA